MASRRSLNAVPGLNRKRPWTVRPLMETRVGGSGMKRSFLAIPSKDGKTRSHLTTIFTRDLGRQRTIPNDSDRGFSMENEKLGTAPNPALATDGRLRRPHGEA